MSGETSVGRGKNRGSNIIHIIKSSKNKYNKQQQQETLIRKVLLYTAAAHYILNKVRNGKQRQKTF